MRFHEAFSSYNHRRPGQNGHVTAFQSVVRAKRQKYSAPMARRQGRAGFKPSTGRDGMRWSVGSELAWLKQEEDEAYSLILFHF
jgi:hypothetical protein